MIDQTKPPRARGLQSSTKISLPTNFRAVEARASKGETRNVEVRGEIGGGDEVDDREVDSNKHLVR